MSTLTKENENYKSVVAQKDLELKKYQERYVCIYVHAFVFNLLYMYSYIIQYIFKSFHA